MKNNFNEDDKKVYQTDLIYRSDAIKAYNDAMDELVKSQMEEFNLADFTECEFDTTQCKLIARKIESVPAIEPKQGEWIYCEEDDSHLPEDGWYGIFKCNNCGNKQSFPISEGSGRVYGDNYCSSCGAHMKEAVDED